MKKTVNVSTTITVDLTAQDVDEIVKEKKLVPADWEFYSVEVEGCGVSEGGRLIIKSSHTKP